MKKNILIITSMLLTLTLVTGCGCTKNDKINEINNSISINKPIYLP